MNTVAGIIGPLVLATTVACSAAAEARSGVQSADLYVKRCAACHGASAASFGNRHLVMRNGKLMLRGSGRALDSLLNHHGGLSASEVLSLIALLEPHAAQ